MDIKERIKKYLEAYKDIYNRNSDNKNNLIDKVELNLFEYKKDNRYVYNIEIKIDYVLIWKKTYFSFEKNDEAKTQLLENVLLEICVYGLNSAYDRALKRNHENN